MLRAKVRFVVKLEAFHNSELFIPGLYCLRVQLHHQDEDNVYFAKPVLFEDSSQEGAAKESRAKLFHHLADPQIRDSNSSFVSKVFMIRYADEDVTLLNTIKYETYVDVKRFHQKESRL